MKYLNLDTDDTLGGDNASDSVIPSQKAIRTFVRNSIPSITVESDTAGNVVLGVTGMAVADDDNGNVIITQ